MSLSLNEQPKSNLSTSQKRKDDLPFVSDNTRTKNQQQSEVANSTTQLLGRDPNIIAAELWHEQQRIGKTMLESCIKQGKLLNEAKQIVMHGDWQSWLKENFYHSERTAEIYMRLAREFSNPKSISDLTIAKAVALLDIPPDKWNEFLESIHNVKGVPTKAREMSDINFKNAIYEYKCEEKIKAKKNKTVNGIDNPMDSETENDNNTGNDHIYTGNVETQNNAEAVDDSNLNTENESGSKITDVTNVEPPDSGHGDTENPTVDNLDNYLDRVFGNHIQNFYLCLENVHKNLEIMISERTICQDISTVFEKMNEDVKNMFDHYLQIFRYTNIENFD